VHQPDGFEAALARTESDLGSAAQSTATLLRELRRARTAASLGQVRDLRRALDGAQALTQQLAEQVEQAQQGYAVDEIAVLSSGDYRQELLAAASAAGVSMFEEDERLLCYPSLVRVLPAELALDIDRRRERRLRPSVVVELLAAAQRRGPRFRPEPFLRSLLSGYELVTAQQHKAAGAVVRLLDVYGVLTLLPGQTKDYSKQEFARDLYLLDQSGLTALAGAGRRLRWAASTGTRQPGVLTTVGRSGQQQRYWGIAFEEVGGD
jgi:hypothetical protein